MISQVCEGGLNSSFSSLFVCKTKCRTIKACSKPVHVTHCGPTTFYQMSLEVHLHLNITCVLHWQHVHSPIPSHSHSVWSLLAVFLWLFCQSEHVRGNLPIFICLLFCRIVVSRPHKKKLHLGVVTKLVVRKYKGGQKIFAYWTMLCY